MARVRVPIRFSRSSLVWRRWFCIFTITSSNLPNSVLTSPSTCQTSLDRFWIARVRNPICRELSSAAIVDGTWDSSAAKDLFGEIASAMGCVGADGAGDPKAAAAKLSQIFESLELEVPKATPEQFEILKTSVNPVRLKNHPIALDVDTIDMLYHKILKADS